MPPTPDVGPVAPDAGRLEPVAEGVWVWLGTDGRGGAGPNVGVVVEADGITLVDSLAAPSPARALNQALASFGVPVRRLVYTSSHVESVGGSSVFWMAARYGRSQTSALLEQAVPVDAYRHLVPGFAADYDEEGFATRPVSHVVDVAAWLTERVCVVPVSGPQAENLVVVVPDAGTLFTGALACFGATPNAYDGDPETWADTLGDLAEQAPVVVPGRGPVGSGGHLVALQAYLYAVAEAEGDAGRIPDGPWDEWTDRDLDEVNVERAAALAAGGGGVPPSMLRRLGLA